MASSSVGVAIKHAKKKGRIPPPPQQSMDTPEVEIQRKITPTIKHILSNMLATEPCDRLEHPPIDVPLDECNQEEAEEILADSSVLPMSNAILLHVPTSLSPPLPENAVYIPPKPVNAQPSRTTSIWGRLFGFTYNKYD